MASKVEILKSQLESLNTEFAEKQFILRTKQCQLSGLKDDIINLEATLQELQGTKASLNITISALSNEIELQKLHTFNELIHHIC